MTIPKPWTIDFESDGIEPRPAYPPKPAGVSIKPWGKKARYYAFGHQTGNNCTEGEAKQMLLKVWRSGEPLLFQNAKFDVDVADAAWKLGIPPWSQIHDTLFLLFLHDPHARSLSLKPAAHRLLGWEPEERDAVGDWLLEHQPVPGVKISAAPGSDHYFMRYLRYAPGALVGRYANGDVDRTEALFRKLWPEIQTRGMLDAYDRERRLMPHLLQSERQGVRVAQRRLGQDVERFTDLQATIDRWVVKRLRGGADLNLDSSEQLMHALVRAKKVDLALVPHTPKSTPEKPRLRSDKGTLERAMTDKPLMAVLRYRAQLGTCLETFMRPWLATAKQSRGLIFTTWHQTRGEDEGGARTGRLSSTPNFQNIPTELDEKFRDFMKDLKKALRDLPPLPAVRSYIVPWADDHVLLDRDYSQQELRVLGHFEDDVLAGRYREDPWLDVHSFAQQLIIERTGRHWDRKPVKNTGFGLLYGMGVGKLAVMSKLDIEEALSLKNAYLGIFPSLKRMYGEMKARARANKPIRTWGGREYYCEPPKIIDGRVRQFDYKLLNVLIQGSSADITKEAFIRYCDTKPRDHKALINVHDEILVSCPLAELGTGMACLKTAMESVALDVPLLSEGTAGHTWDDLKDYDKRGEELYGRRRA